MLPTTLGYTTLHDTTLHDATHRLHDAMLQHCALPMFFRYGWHAIRYVNPCHAQAYRAASYLEHLERRCAT